MANVCCDYLPTGWEPIDGEHARLAAHLDELLAAVSLPDPARARAALGALLPAFAEHFAREERLMSGSGFPRAARHKQAHDQFLADVEGHARRAAAEGLTPELRGWAMGPAHQWFRTHISGNDVALGLYLLERERRCLEGPARPTARAASR